MSDFPSPAMWSAGALALAVLLVTRYLTGWFLRYALAQRLLDVPNARSSHVVATPRGGGMAIVLTTLLGLVAAGFLHLLAWPLVCGMAGAGALVGAIGFVDDHRPLPKRWRLLGHLIAAAWVLAWFGGQPSLPVLGQVSSPGWLADALAVLYLVWLINLTNFMDGIDGIAATEAITVAAGGMLLSLLVAPNDHQWTASLLLAAAAAGFLIWNWPPAKIFMGDAGSGFMGLMLGALSLAAAGAAPALLGSWIILLGVFIVDATTTLTRRIVRGDRFYEAHRSHVYQHAAERLGAHKPVTVAVGVINLCWLLPLAALVARGAIGAGVGVLIAYAPLVAVALKIGAGRSSPSSAQLDPSNV